MTKSLLLKQAFLSFLFSNLKRPGKSSYNTYSAVLAVGCAVYFWYVILSK